MDLNELEYHSVDWFQLIQGRVQSRDLVKTVMKLWLHKR